MEAVTNALDTNALSLAFQFWSLVTKPIAFYLSFTVKIIKVNGEH